MRIKNGEVELLLDRDELWVETPTVRSVLDELHHLLDGSRERPRAWQPLPVLWGDHGVGKTALARHFVREARGAVSCHLSCPGVCSPARSLHLDLDAGTPVSTRFYDEPESDLHGDERRTTLVFIEGADQLLHVDRRIRSRHLASFMEHPRFLHVLVGSSDLLREVRNFFGVATDLRLPEMDLVELTRFADLLFGTSDHQLVVRLCQETRGNLGLLLNLARRNGSLQRLRKAARAHVPLGNGLLDAPDRATRPSAPTPRPS